MTNLEALRLKRGTPKHNCPIEREFEQFRKAMKKARGLANFSFTAECEVCNDR